MTASTCASCGRPVDAHDRHVRFTLPDPVLDRPGQAEGAWLSGPDPAASVMMVVEDLGGFVRCLLPVRLTEGFTVTFGVWLGVHPDEVRRAFEVWWQPAYRDLVLTGRLANALPGWGLLGTDARAVVQDVDATPYVVESADPQLTRVLKAEWPHDEVLSNLPRD